MIQDRIMYFMFFDILAMLIRMVVALARCEGHFVGCSAFNQHLSFFSFCDALIYNQHLSFSFLLFFQLEHISFSFLSTRKPFFLFSFKQNTFLSFFFQLEHLSFSFLLFFQLEHLSFSFLLFFQLEHLFSLFFQLEHLSFSFLSTITPFFLFSFNQNTFLSLFFFLLCLDTKVVNLIPPFLFSILRYKYTQKNLIKSIRNQIVFTLFRSIWIQMNRKMINTI